MSEDTTKSLDEMTKETKVDADGFAVEEDSPKMTGTGSDMMDGTQSMAASLKGKVSMAPGLRNSVQAFLDQTSEGDGTIEGLIKVLAEGAVDEEKEKKKQLALKRWWQKMACAILVGAVLLIGVLFGCMVASQELTKETYAASNGLLTVPGTNATVQTRQVEMSVPLGALPRLPWDVLDKIRQVNIAQKMSRNVDGMDKHGKDSMTLYTTMGDKIKILSAFNGEIVLANGTAKPVCAACSACSSVNIVATEATSAIMDQYWADVDNGLESGATKETYCAGLPNSKARRLQQERRLLTEAECLAMEGPWGW